MDLAMFRRCAPFLGIAYGLTCVIAGAFWLLGGRLGTGAGSLVAAACMFTPTVAAVVMQRLRGEPIRVLGLRFVWNRWIVVAWLLPLVMVGLALGLGLLLPGVAWSADFSGLVERLAGVAPPEQLEAMRQKLAETPPWVIVLMSVVQPLVAGITINAVAALGEELGWRGWLQRETASMGFWRQSLFIGVVWGLWHAPLILQGHNYPAHPVIGVGMMVLFTLLLTPLHAVLRDRAGTVLAAAVFHGTINAAGGLAYMFLRGGSDLQVGLTGAAGLMALLVVNVAWFAVMGVPPSAVREGEAPAEPG